MTTARAAVEHVERDRGRVDVARASRAPWPAPARGRGRGPTRRPPHDGGRAPAPRRATNGPRLRRRGRCTRSRAHASRRRPRGTRGRGRCRPAAAPRRARRARPPCRPRAGAAAGDGSPSRRRSRRSGRPARRRRGATIVTASTAASSRVSVAVDGRARRAGSGAAMSRPASSRHTTSRSCSIAVLVAHRPPDARGRRPVDLAHVVVGQVVAHRLELGAEPERAAGTQARVAEATASQRDDQPLCGVHVGIHEQLARPLGIERARTRAATVRNGARRPAEVGVPRDGARRASRRSSPILSPARW